MISKKKYRYLMLIFMTFSAFATAKSPAIIHWQKTALSFAEKQLLLAASAYKETKKNPRTFENGKVELVDYNDWTSGFFPGSLWYLYEITRDTNLRVEAERFTAFVNRAQYRTNTHDLGFIINSSYGNGYRLTGNKTYLSVMTDAATTLMKRYNPKTGLIKSWDAGVGAWEYPVIIDNMMNLELLYCIGVKTNNREMVNAAISHADKTLSNHFRKDFSCFHVVEYDSITGKVISKVTHQGFSNNSSWARGQAWALYGFTMMYRFSRKPEYLSLAKNIASFILNHPRLPADKIPYWDFDAPKIPDEPRDASSAAIIASALIELSTFCKDGSDCLKSAELILKNLSSEKYLAKKGENGLFVLKHSTGNWPKQSEIDAPIAYADYYYLEALKRLIELKK